jgi:hypothetical protein
MRERERRRECGETFEPQQCAYAATDEASRRR